MSDEAVKTEETGTEEDKQPEDEVKVVIRVKGKNALLGIETPGCDPIFETIMDVTFEGALAAVPALVEMARLRWKTNPRNTNYDRPAPPPPPPGIQPAPRPAMPTRSRGGEKVEEYKLL